MSYPFANPQYAQHSSQGHPGYDQHYGGSNHSDSYDSAYRRDAAAAGAGYGGGGYANERQDDEMRRFDAHELPRVPEKDGVAEYDDEAARSKMYNEGNSPYGPSTGAVDGAVYGKSKSIWTADDKRVMAKRSVPAKLFRALFCVIINAIIVIVSIVCLVVIFARPFNVGIGNMSAPSSSSVGISGSAITFNGSVDFIVSNPNSISSELSLSAKVFDTVDKSQDIGRGSVSKSKIEANSNSTIHFPYQVRYDPTADSSKTILRDLVQKCGLLGGSAQNLDLTLDIDASLSILSVPVPVSFSQAISFKCPLTSDILKSIGGKDLSSIISGLGSRALAATIRDEL